MAKVEVICEVCEKPFLRLPYEVKRNAKLGRANCCSRHCHAVYMNKSVAAREWRSQESSQNQFGKDNPNWKGGISAKAKGD